MLKFQMGIWVWGTLFNLVFCKEKNYIISINVEKLFDKLNMH